jgi:hypothetical protein
LHDELGEAKRPLHYLATHPGLHVIAQWNVSQGVRTDVEQSLDIHARE